jgi:hypothetical protein
VEAAAGGGVPKGVAAAVGAAAAGAGALSGWLHPANASAERMAIKFFRIGCFMKRLAL